MANILYVGFECSTHKMMLEKIAEFNAAWGHQFIVGSSNTLNNNVQNNVVIDRDVKGYSRDLHWYTAEFVCPFSAKHQKKLSPYRFPSIE